MRVEYVNPFVVSAFYVLDKTARLKATKGELSLKASPYPSEDVTIVIGVTGVIRGQVLYSMTLQTAKDLSSAMMMGIPVEEFDEMAKSAVCELANIITGNASIELSNNGYECDVTPPSLITGTNMQISTVDIRTLVVPIFSEAGKIEINIALKEREE